jgi:diguanylate cyclase (GGDEF)-like protein
MKNTLTNLMRYTREFRDDERDAQHKVIFLKYVFFFASLVTFVLGLFQWENNATLGGIYFLISFSMLSCLYYLNHHQEKVDLIGTLSLTFFFMFFYSFYIITSYNTLRLSVFLILSASAYYLKGRVLGFLWMLFILISIVAGHVFKLSSHAYTNLDILTTSLNLIALFFIFDNYEVIREEKTESLKLLNAELEKKILKRTKELQRLNEALLIDKKALERLSCTDPLTGLFNRYKLRDIFEFEASQAKRFKTSLSLILMDIDFFKSINDRHGHNIGDIVLTELSMLLKRSVRKSDVVVRWGGEEFIIFAPKTSLSQSIVLAEKLRQGIRNHQFSPLLQQVTLSFGVTALEEGDKLEQIIQRADKALYLAKESGRDNVKSYTDHVMLEKSSAKQGEIKPSDRVVPVSRGGMTE